MFSLAHRKLPSFVLQLLLVFMGFCLHEQARAQAWPSKPIIFVTAGAPGDGLDLITRVFAQSMSKALGQSIVVDNRPGGGGKISMEYIKNAHPDG